MKKDYEAYFEANRAGWNLRTAVHMQSEFYALDAWKNGRTSLKPIELNEVGDVRDKKLLHLQCHFGQDTLSWARLGAEVTGVDLSDTAIEQARQLSAESGIPGRFIRCNLYDLPEHLDEQFDVVFTSYGTIGWLPDLEAWAALIYRYLRPGGVFYIAEFHPMVWMFDDQFTKFEYSYFNLETIRTDNVGTYADRARTDEAVEPIRYTDYGWNHPLSEVISCLTAAGLIIAFLHEFPYSPFNCFSNTVSDEQGNYRIKGLENKLPMVFSIRARKP